jgi:signal transduction histidine kinase
VSSPNVLAALAQAPAWLADTTEPAALNPVVAGWARACGWRAAGLVWPVEAPTVVVACLNGSASPSPSPPADLVDIARRLRSGEGAIVGPGAGGSVRMSVSFTPPGRAAGLLWAETAPGRVMTDTDRSLVTLAARMAEKSPAVLAAVGPGVDPERLLQRLSDASVIAGRMAHDFDNILTGIIGFADLTSPMLSPGSQASQFVGEIAKVGHRGITFTQQLHQLSRAGQVKPNPGMLTAAVAKEEMRIRSQVNPGVRVEKELAPNLPPVATETGPLQVVVGHLMENAAEACTAGGVVTVTARTVDLTDADARTYLGKAEAGAYLEVTVADSGSGIKPDARRRLFNEPFFTTKVRHRGLGLAIVYRILSAHRGGVQLDPVPPPGTGTRARFVLPLAPTRPPAAVAGSPPLSATPPPAVRTVGGNVTATTVGG